MQGTAIEAIWSVMESVAWLGLLHSLWVGLAAASIVKIVLSGRGSLGPEARCRILGSAVLITGLGPVGLAFLHQDIVSQRHATPAVQVSGATINEVGEYKGLDGSRGGPALAGIQSATSKEASRLAQARPVLLKIWAGGIVSMLASLAIGLFASSRIKAGGRVAPDPVARAADRLARRLAMKRTPAVLLHPRLSQPALHGLLRPAILLPGAWAEWANAGELDAVLAHELAHASRRDPVANLAQRLLEALLFFHPAFRWLSASLRRQREHRADAVAVRLTGDPLALARALESFGRARRRPSRFGPIVPAFADDSSLVLLNRIQEILGMMPQNRRFNLWPIVAFPASCMLAVAALMQPVQATGSRPSDASQRQAVPFVTLEGPQLSLEVQFLDLDPEAASILPEVDFVATEGKPFDVWTLSDLELLQLRNRVQALGDRAQLVSAPKTTIFEGSSAIFVQADDGVSNDLRMPAPRMYVKVGGTYSEGRIHGHCIVGRSWPRNQPRREAMDQMSWDNPDGSNLVLRPRRPDIGLVAGKQRLLLITTRHVLTEEEEAVLGIPEAPAKPRPR